MKYCFIRVIAAVSGSLAALNLYESLVCNWSSELGGLMTIRGQPELGPRTPIPTFGVSGLAAGYYAKNQSIAVSASGLMSGFMQRTNGLRTQSRPLPHYRR